jgi:FkbM family methyltransferase
MDSSVEKWDTWEVQLSELQRVTRKLARDQDLLLRRLNELLHSHSTYLGDRRLLTRLRTGQSMFVDGRDKGCGLSLIKDGWTEPNVMRVLQRTFFRNAVFLDVGANFGFYSIMAGGQIGPGGKVYAFEANPYLKDFIKDSAHVNGLRSVVEIVNKAVSDREGMARFGFSFAGIGGGSLAKGARDDDEELTYIDVPLVRIDDALSKNLVVDSAKLDVEGNELAALQGMRGVIERSPDIQIVMEFFPGLLAHAGGRSGVIDFLTEVGLNYWRIDGRGHLETVPRSELLRAEPCYLLAARSRPNDRALVLREDCLRVPAAADASGYLTGPTGALLVHGPYWHLQAGVYRVLVEGEIEGSLDVALAHDFGFVVASGRINSTQRTLDVGLAQDVRQFEVVIRSTGLTSKLKLDRIEIQDR